MSSDSILSAAISPMRPPVEMGPWSREPAQDEARAVEVHHRRRSPRPAEQPVAVSPFEDVLPLRDFLSTLEREKRRSDRSKSPLSLALFRLDGDARRMLAFLDSMHQATRETDVVGHASSDLLALLCPDTDAEGIRTVLRRVEAAATGTPFVTVAVVTHPDVLFDKIHDGDMSGDAAPPARRPATAFQLAPAFVAERPGRNRHGYALKRTIDVTGALAGIVCLAPVMCLAAVAVAVSSRGPVIFRQTRLGQNGKPFSFYKFRSMVAGGDDRVHRDFVAKLIDGESTGADPSEGAAPVYKLNSDARITPVGRLIRKTSIDELPQLFNVLKGDMSLVGPRPPISYEAAGYQAWHLRRLLVAKPGLTGLWQVEGRSRVSFNEMVRMDLRYIRDCSLEMDLRIMLKTVKVVLRCEGAK